MTVEEKGPSELGWFGETPNELCGCSFRNDGPLLLRLYCTRPKGHAGNHIAAIGPYTPDTPVLQEWPQ